MQRLILIILTTLLSLNNPLLARTQIQTNILANMVNFYNIDLSKEILPNISLCWSSTVYKAANSQFWKTPFTSHSLLFKVITNQNKNRFFRVGLKQVTQTPVGQEWLKDYPFHGLYLEWGKENALSKRIFTQFSLGLSIFHFYQRNIDPYESARIQPIPITPSMSLSIGFIL